MSLPVETRATVALKAPVQTASVGATRTASASYQADSFIMTNFQRHQVFFGLQFTNDAIKSANANWAVGGWAHTALAVMEYTFGVAMCLVADLIKTAAAFATVLPVVSTVVNAYKGERSTIFGSWCDFSRNSDFNISMNGNSQAQWEELARSEQERTNELQFATGLNGNNNAYQPARARCIEARNTIIDSYLGRNLDTQEILKQIDIDSKWFNALRNREYPTTEPDGIRPEFLTVSLFDTAVTDLKAAAHPRLLGKLRTDVTGDMYLDLPQARYTHKSITATIADLDSIPHGEEQTLAALRNSLQTDGAAFEEGARRLEQVCNPANDSQAFEGYVKGKQKALEETVTTLTAQTESVPADVLARLRETIVCDLFKNNKLHEGKVKENIDGLKLENVKTYADLHKELEAIIGRLEGQIKTYLASPEAARAANLLDRLKARVDFQGTAEEIARLHAECPGLMAFEKAKDQLHHIKTASGYSKLKDERVVLVKQLENAVQQKNNVRGTCEAQVLERRKLIDLLYVNAEGQPRIKWSENVLRFKAPEAPKVAARTEEKTELKRVSAKKGASDLPDESGVQTSDGEVGETFTEPSDIGDRTDDETDETQPAPKKAESGKAATVKTETAKAPAKTVAAKVEEIEDEGDIDDLNLDE